MTDSEQEQVRRLQQRVAELEDENAMLRLKTRDVASANVNAAMQLVEMTEQRTRELEAKNADIARALRMAEESSEHKSRFLATMSHELRTPISGIIGMADLLANTELSLSQRERVDAISSTAASFLDLVNQLLDFSKAEANAIEVEHQEFDLWRVNETVAQLLQVSADSKGVELLFDIDPELPRLALGDALRIRQVVLNLGINAVKFTNVGVVSLRVARGRGPDGEVTSNREGRDRDDSNWVEWTVADSGCGFDEATAKKIFEPFVQADASTTRRYGGTGLGLSISRQLVECMGGRIDYQSEPGKGSTFVVALPLQFIDREFEPPPQPRCARVRVERPSTFRLLEAHLPRLGYRILAGDDAAAADLLVIEPARDAKAAVEAVRAQGETTPILLVDCPGAQLPEREYEEAGILAVLHRPVLPTNLESVLRHFERRHGRSEELSQQSFEGRRVLVADDSPINLRVLSDRLRSYGCEVTEVVDGAEAVSECRQSQFDLVFLDCQMPVLDGYQAARKIRALERGLGRNHVPVLAITADASHGNEARCLAEGMSGFCVKPLRARQVEDLLCRWLGEPKPRPGTTNLRST